MSLSTHFVFKMNCANVYGDPNGEVNIFGVEKLDALQAYDRYDAIAKTMLAKTKMLYKNSEWNNSHSVYVSKDAKYDNQYVCIVAVKSEAECSKADAVSLVRKYFKAIAP